MVLISIVIPSYQVSVREERGYTWMLLISLSMDYLVKGKNFRCRLVYAEKGYSIPLIIYYKLYKKAHMYLANFA